MFLRGFDGQRKFKIFIAKIRKTHRQSFVLVTKACKSQADKEIILGELNPWRYNLVQYSRCTMKNKHLATPADSPQQASIFDRRTFLKAGGAALAGSALSLPASSYARVLGANDRIRLGQLGCGDRSGGHVHMVHVASRRVPVETVAVCDLWS